MAHFEKLNENAVIPQRGTALSAGYDLCSIEDATLNPGERILIHTGLNCSMMHNEYLAIVPRSGLALKKGITVLNTPGTVDADYYPNEIGVILYNTSKEIFEIKKGDRIAQAILKTYNIMINDATSDKTREGGFGSTGINVKEV